MLIVSGSVLRRLPRKQHAIYQGADSPTAFQERLLHNPNSITDFKISELGKTRVDIIPELMTNKGLFPVHTMHITPTNYNEARSECGHKSFL